MFSPVEIVDGIGPKRVPTIAARPKIYSNISNYTIIRVTIKIMTCLLFREDHLPTTRSDQTLDKSQASVVPVDPFLLLGHCSCLLHALYGNSTSPNSGYIIISNYTILFFFSFNSTRGFNVSLFSLLSGWVWTG